MEDTIAAIATAPGEGGIGIIRISGEHAYNILRRVFRPAHPESLENRKMSYGHILNPQTNSIIDEVLCVYMKGPKTYTTEDVVEINCHGGMVPLRKTVDCRLCLALQVCSPSQGGELRVFRCRDFSNGWVLFPEVVTGSSKR